MSNNRCRRITRSFGRHRFLSAALLSLLLLALSLLYYRQSPFKERIAFFPRNFSSDDTTPLILQWTRFHRRNQLFLDARSLATWNDDCPQYQCRLTNRRQTLLQADAVLFHHRDAKFDAPPPSLLRRWQQFYVLLNLEPPPTDWWDLAALNRNFFNWTMTYRLDSDIPVPYDDFRPEALLPLVPLERKRRAAAIFLSRCRSPSGREKLLIKLANAGLEIDAFGRCPLENITQRRCPRGHDEVCNRMLGDEYYFYLSLENSRCVDYVSEKFYRALRSGVVPIVNGGADYRRFAPSGRSFIHVDDFRDAEALVAYLTLLMSNRSAYEEYFQWRGRLPASIRHMPAARKMRPYGESGICELCRRLHEVRDGARPIAQSYSDIGRWWRMRPPLFEEEACGEIANYRKKRWLFMWLRSQWNGLF